MLIQNQRICNNEDRIQGGLVDTPRSSYWVWNYSKKMIQTRIPEKLAILNRNGSACSSVRTPQYFIQEMQKLLVPQQGLSSSAEVYQT